MRRALTQESLGVAPDGDAVRVVVRAPRRAGCRLVVRGEDDLGVAVVVDVGDDRVLDAGAARLGFLKSTSPPLAVVDAEEALVVVDDLGGAIAVEVEDARAGDLRLESSSVPRRQPLCRQTHCPWWGCTRRRRRSRRPSCRRRRGCAPGCPAGPRGVVEGRWATRGRRRGSPGDRSDVAAPKGGADLGEAVAVEVVDVGGAAVGPPPRLVKRRSVPVSPSARAGAVVDEHDLGLAVERVARAGAAAGPRRARRRRRRSRRAGRWGRRPGAVHRLAVPRGVELAVAEACSRRRWGGPRRSRRSWSTPRGRRGSGRRWCRR
jgi:hypothetical protein